MNLFVFSCVCPHGGEILPGLQGNDPERMSTTRKSSTSLGMEMKKAKPDVILGLICVAIG